MTQTFRRHFAIAAAGFCILAALIFSGAGAPASAEELTIGYKAEISSADPHYLFGPNRNLSWLVYEPLLSTDAHQKPMPGLAQSWKVIDDTTREFKLRPGVTFSDGSPFTAEDVKFSIDRAQNLKAPRTFRSYLADVAAVEVVGPLTLRIKTKRPSPILLENLATFGIVSHKATKDADSADFNGGRAAVGTGPYRWQKWTPGQDVVLTRNDTYWGGKEPWTKVTYRFIKNDSSRAAALLSGDVDLIDSVPTTIAERLQSDKKFTLLTTPSYLLNYFHLDRHHGVPLFVRNKDGKPLSKNPFNDLKVRHALSMALARARLDERIMDGLAVPAGQLVPAGMTGHVAGLEPMSFDPKKAKKLLADAGYPNGFQLTIHCTRDRYANDAKVCEAAGQMLSSIGIAAKVETLPPPVFFSRASKGGPSKEPEFSMFMVGFGAANGVADAALKALIHTYDKKKGAGSSNRGRYSDQMTDSLIESAAREMDATKRQEFLDKATRRAIDDVAIIPVHFLKATWAYRSDLTMEPRSDQFTLASKIRKR